MAGAAVKMAEVAVLELAAGDGSAIFSYCATSWRSRHCVSSIHLSQEFSCIPARLCHVVGRLDKFYESSMGILQVNLVQW
jgi:hypothetical protein